MGSVLALSASGVRRCSPAFCKAEGRADKGQQDPRSSDIQQLLHRLILIPFKFWCVLTHPNIRILIAFPWRLGKFMGPLCWEGWELFPFDICLQPTRCMLQLHGTTPVYSSVCFRSAAVVQPM